MRRSLRYKLLFLLILSVFTIERYHLVHASGYERCGIYTDCPNPPYATWFWDNPGDCDGYCDDAFAWFDGRTPECQGLTMLCPRECVGDFDQCDTDEDCCPQSYCTENYCCPNCS